MDNEITKLFRVLKVGARHAIDIANEDDGLRVEITLSTKGLLLEAMRQDGGRAYNLHRVPDGYCNQEIEWDDVARLDDAGFRKLLDDLLQCAQEASADGGAPVRFGHKH